MKLVGITMILVAALVFSYGKSAKITERQTVLSELFRFIEYAKIEIGCYLRPISEIAATFTSDTLSGKGFLSDVEKNGAYKAYLSLSEKVSLGEAAEGVLDRFFSLLGTGYAEDEMKLIDATLSELKEILTSEGETATKQKKLSLTLSFSGALALIILLL